MHPSYLQYFFVGVLLAELDELGGSEESKKLMPRPTTTVTARITPVTMSPLPSLIEKDLMLLKIDLMRLTNLCFGVRW